MKLLKRYCNGLFISFFYTGKSCRTRTPTKVFNRSQSSAKELTEYRVKIKTCGSLYQKWYEDKKFRTLPKGDLEFVINYTDTKNQASQIGASAPVVVALHGAPGSCKEFSGLSSHLHYQGARVVAPTLPDFSRYKPGVFRHSAEEKAQFVKDFLSAISISQVDALVVHSSAVYPGLLLCLENNPAIKSLIMLNTLTHSSEMKGLRYIKALRVVTGLSEIPSVLKIMETLGPIVLRIIKTPVKTENFLDPLLSITTVVHSGFSKANEKFLQLKNKNFPMLYAFSEDDKLVGKKCSDELAHLLGASDSDMFTYDKDGKLKQNGKESSILKVMSFEQGSHYVFLKYGDIINRAIALFIKKL